MLLPTPNNDVAMLQEEANYAISVNRLQLSVRIVELVVRKFRLLILLSKTSCQPRRERCIKRAEIRVDMAATGWELRIRDERTWAHAARFSHEMRVCLHEA